MGTVIVSKHSATVKYLLNLFPDADVIDHIDSVSGIPSGATVIGNLPVSIIDQLLKRGCTVYITVMHVPRELRGKELTLEDVARYIEIYQVCDMTLSRVYLT